MASDTACLAPIWTPTLPFKPLFFQMYSPQPDTIPTIRSPSPEARRRFFYLFYFILFFYSARDRVSDTVVCNGVKALSDGLVFLR